MKLLEKHKIITISCILLIFLAIVILLFNKSIFDFQKLKGDVSNFTPQANYDLSTNNKIDPTTWVAVDNLGRTVPSKGESFNSKTVGLKDTTGKQVGLFYHNWHNVVRHDTYDAYVIPQIWNSIGNPNNKLFASWSDKGTTGSLWWGEPVYGFYNPKDKYVVRKQIELIADAGVDFIVLDYTNWNVLYDKNGKNVNKKDAYAATGDELSNSVFPDELTVLFTVLDEAQEDGIKTPKVTFMLSHLACDRSECGEDGDKVVLPPDSPFYGIMPTYNEQTRNIVQWLWDNVYNNGNYKEHLLYGGGNKPIILAQHPSATTWLPDDKHTFITEGSAHWRFMGNQYEAASTNPSGYDWSWIDKYPQTIYTFNNEIPVSPAQHTIAEQGVNAIAFSFADTQGVPILGRSNAVGDNYSYKFKYRNKDYEVGKDFQLVSGTGVGTLYGRNFQQQWDYAIDNNPKFVMVTGWNEYLVGSGNYNGYINFVDQYNDEYSRDLEPVKGSLKDSYYYQLVTNVRLYKGANSQKSQSTSKSIDIYGDPNQWKDSNLVDYNSYTNTKSKERNVNNNKWGYRNDPSFSSNVETLTSAPVVNDIRTAKVSYDASYIYFYVETVENIDYEKIDKLRLLIDTLPSTTSTSTTNWNEFEYVINREGKSNSTLKLERVKTGCKNDALPSESNSTCAWESVGRVYYSIVNNTMQVSIPRSYLGLTSKNINFNFKWTDNNLGNLEKMYDIMTVYTDGDAAPGGRFAYKFSGSEPYSAPQTYTVKFNANGGTGGQSANVSATFGAKMPTISTTKPTRPGYTFMGWYDNATYTSGTRYYTASGSSARLFNKTTTTTLYAGWKASTYTVSFDANGGTGGQSADVTATYGSAMPTISTTKPTRAGYTFMGWYDNATYTSGTQYYTAAGASAKNFDKTSATILYAGWKAKTYTITYDANGGTGAPSSQSYTYAPSGTVSLSNIEPERYGYTFLGWSESSDATTAQYTAGQSLNKSKAKNYTLYAVWVESDNIIDISPLTIRENIIILDHDSTLSSIYNTINNDHGITIYDNDQEVGLNTILKTNNILHVNNDTYYIAILGDVKADGIIDIRDVAKAYDGLANHNYTAYTDAEKYALDMNNDNKKSILDLIKIYNAMN